MRLLLKISITPLILIQNSYFALLIADNYIPRLDNMILHSEDLNRAIKSKDPTMLSPYVNRWLIIFSLGTE